MSITAANTSQHVPLSAPGAVAFFKAHMLNAKFLNRKWGYHTPFDAHNITCLAPMGATRGTLGVPMSLKYDAVVRSDIGQRLLLSPLLRSLLP